VPCRPLVIRLLWIGGLVLLLMIIVLITDQFR